MKIIFHVFLGTLVRRPVTGFTMERGLKTEGLVSDTRKGLATECVLTSVWVPPSAVHTYCFIFGGVTVSWVQVVVGEVNPLTVAPVMAPERLNAIRLDAPHQEV